MADDTPRKHPVKVAQSDRRAERLAGELRANLKRRKAASRAKVTTGTPGDEPEKPDL